MVAIFMNLPLWRPKSVKFSRFLLCCIEGEKLFKHETLYPIWQRITWSLNCAYTGLWPTCGPRGEALTGKHARLAGKLLSAGAERYTCTEIRGDWQWFKEVFRFPDCAWNAKKICYKCPARRDGDPSLLYHLHGEEPGLWLNKEFGPVSFLRQRTPRHDPCTLFKILMILHTQTLVVNATGRSVNTSKELLHVYASEGPLSMLAVKTR